jgi:hypothetical protein
LKPGTFEIHWITESTNGTVTSSGTEVTTICKVLGIPIHCTYVTSNTDLGTLTGGSPAKLSISNAEIPVDVENSDGICPEEAKWTATYEVASPESLFVTKLAGLTLTPDPVIFFEAGETKGVDIRNTGTVPLENLSIELENKEDFAANKECKEVTLQPDEACDEILKCLNENAEGGMLAGSKEPIAGVETKLEC